MHEGMRKHLFLDLYLVPEVDRQAKLCNENAMKRAMVIRSEYILHPERIGLVLQQRRKEKLTSPQIRTLPEWLDRYKELMEQGGSSASLMIIVTRVNFLIRSYLDYIRRPSFLLSKIDKTFVQGFLSWMRKKYKDARSKKTVCGLSGGSLALYQTRFNCVLNRAVKEGLIERNPFYSLSPQDRYKTPATKREYLTKDELERFLAVKTNGRALQQAFGFACFTGLRRSDIIALTWGNIRTMGADKYVSITMRKTKERVVVPLGKKALLCLPDRPAGASDNDRVFHLPTETAMRNSCEWIAAKAGISKHVSFNTSRHTFATLVLEACKDIKTVSKLLGHKSVHTTQIYAEVLMASKTEAVNRLNGRFGTV
ncbi:MAG: site-specific integrase [Bacteroidales bacterium]|nr:site-specific integrase [Bacteroidales bacterium]